MNSKLIAFLAATCLVALVHAEAGWFCGQNSQDISSLAACSSGDVIGFNLPSGYKPGDCFDDFTDRTREVVCLNQDPDGEAGATMNIVDDNECAAAGEKPALTISSTVCAYDWACSTDGTAFSSCTEDSFACVANDPDNVSSQCYSGTFTRTVKCANQSSVEAADKCTGDAPASTNGACDVTEGCQGQWVRSLKDSPAPSSLPVEPCSSGDTTTGYAETTCVVTESERLTRSVRCFYMVDGVLREDVSGMLCAETKPEVEKVVPQCGEWEQIEGECVWNRKSCQEGLATISYECPDGRICPETKPEDDGTQAQCSTDSNHCTAEFACAPTADTPLADYQPCTVNDKVGFVLPEEDACVETVPKRDVKCLSKIIDGDSGFEPTTYDLTTCSSDESEHPNTEYHDASVLCVYEWMCSVNGGASFHTCNDQDFYHVCTPQDPAAVATQCYIGNFTRIVKCINQSGVEGDSKCTGQQPETSGDICEVRSGCQYKWYCHTSDTSVPTTSPDEDCAAGDTTTGFPATPTCWTGEAQSLSRNVKCYTFFSGLGYSEDATACDYYFRPTPTLALPECGQWKQVIGECVWDRESCNSGTKQITWSCDAAQGCAGAQPQSTSQACTTDLQHCSYGFACAPTADVPLNERLPCVPGDTVGFILPEEGACVETVPTRDVVCRATIKDGEQVLKYEEVAQAHCAIYPMPVPSTTHPESVCRYQWLCSIGDGLNECVDSYFTCTPNNPATAAPQCYSGVASRVAKCVNQFMDESDGKCLDAAPATTNGACDVTEGCERKWVCTSTDAAPETMPTEACVAGDTTTGFPATPTCWEGEAQSLSRAVGCYYALEGVVVKDEAKDACSQPQPSTSKALTECGQWLKITGTCVWDGQSCNTGSAEVTYRCDTAQGCVTSKPEAGTETCITTDKHCSYTYVCAQTESTDPTQYSACAYGDTVGFDLPTSGCVDEVAPRAVACLQTLTDETSTTTTTFVDMTSCAGTAAQAPNTVYGQTDVICDYDWQCSVDGTTFACSNAQFTCQASDPTISASKCFSGQQTRTVKCVSEDDRVVDDSKCSGAAPAATNGACTERGGCQGMWVCASTGSAAPETMPAEACAKTDLTTGFPTTPTCWEGEAKPLSRDVSCYYVFDGKVTLQENGFYCNAGAIPSREIPLPQCVAWTLQTGTCIWDGDMDTCTIGTRIDTYVCAEGEGKCVANKPKDVTVACTFPTSQCGYRYVCAPADATTDDIFEMTTAELSCADDKHFVFDAMACYKDKVFTRTVACFDAKNKVISNNAAEDCKDEDAPVDHVTRTDEQQCRVDTYCAPTADAAESAWVKCVDEQGNSITSTFGPCTVDCSTATQTRAARCVNELGTVLSNDSCDMDDVELEQYCAAPAQVSQVSVSSDTLTVGEEVEVQWCYYDGSIPTEGPTPTATVNTATVTLSSASKKFFATVVASTGAKVGGVQFDMPVVAPAADAMFTVTVGALHSDSASLTVQSRCTADASYCGKHGTCNDATSTCTCTDGFTSVQCDVSPCYKCGGPFSHTTSCVDSGAEAGVCVCESGYEGVACEVKTDCKTTKKCQHGGFVGTDMNGVCAEVCTCTNKWMGASCDTCDNFCTGTANGKPDANCQACVCTRGYSGAACQCKQAYGALVFAGASATTLQDRQWLSALQRAILFVTGLFEDAVEVSAAAANKGIIVVALTACPFQPEAASHTALDTTALYAKWVMVVADLKADSSVLKRGVLADLGTSVTTTATEDMYDPTCTGDGCAKGEDPFEKTDNAAAAAMLSATTVAAVVFLALLF